MLNFEAAIFDLDGTLLDSMGVWGRVDELFLAGRGIKVPETYVDAISAMTFRETAAYTIELFNLDATAEGLMSEWSGMALLEYSKNVRLKPFAEEYLLRLKSLGVKLATATSLSRELAGPALANNGIGGLFDAQCFSDEIGRGKEFPDVYLLAARKMDMPPERCVVFEDLPQGIISARNAGMRVVCVLDEAFKKHWPKMCEHADACLYDFENAPVPG